MTPRARTALFCAAAVAFATLHTSWLRHDAPGSVTQATAAEICRVGYSRTQRPPHWYTWTLKRLGTWQPTQYQLDHRIPLQLGGRGWAWSNLWLLPWPVAARKDAEGNRLRAMVCRGEITLYEAQQAFRQHIVPVPQRAAPARWPIQAL